MNDLITTDKISGGAVYGVEQATYTVEGVSGQDYTAALTKAAFKESVSIEEAASAYAAVTRQRQRKVEDLGQVLAVLAHAIATMNPKSNDVNKRSEQNSGIYEAQGTLNKYGITLSFAAVSASTSGGTASITYATATRVQNDVQYALDKEDNDLQQDIVALQSFIAKRDNAFAAAAKLVKKSAGTARTTIANIGG